MLTDNCKLSHNYIRIMIAIANENWSGNENFILGEKGTVK